MTDSLPRLFNKKKAAAYLDIDVKTLGRLVDAGKLKYILVEPTTLRKYDIKDLDAYIDEQRGAPCPSTKLKNHRSCNTTSRSPAIDFMALRKQRHEKKQKESRRRSESRPAPV